MRWRHWFYIVPLRLRSLLRRKQVEQELDDEIAFHVEMASRYENAGLTGDAARRNAHRDLGGIALVKDACRDALRMAWVDGLARDLRYAARLLRRSPAFTLVAIASLAVGIFVNCAAFSWADALLLRPLAVPRPFDLLTVGSDAGAAGSFHFVRASYPEYTAIRDRSTSFSGLLAFNSIVGGLTASRGELPKLRVGALVSGNFFNVLGVEPVLGRTFLPEEADPPNRGNVIVLGHRLWRQQFGADPSIIGRQVYLIGEPLTVVGVAPPGFLGLEQFVQADLFVPLSMTARLAPPSTDDPLEVRDTRVWFLRGRLKPGVELKTAAAELSVIAKDLERSFPDTNRNHAIVVATEMQARVAQVPPLTMLIAMLSILAASVLFVACANVAGLLTSRAPSRARELALRSAIGAGRAGLVRQLMAESTLIAIGAGILGLGAGALAIRLFQRLQIPTDFTIGFEFHLDRRALGFGLMVAAASALVFGLAPAVRASRVDLTSIMKSSDTAAGGRRWGPGFLVILQVAVSVVLLVIAGFTYRGFRQELTEGPGYRLDHLLKMNFDPALMRYTESEARVFYTRLLERVQSLPGVKSVSLASSVPMQTVQLGGSTMVPEGFQPAPGMENVSIMSARIDEHYLSLMRIPILRGREFRREDDLNAPRVAIVNALAAEHYWPGQDPIGKRLRLEGNPPTWLEVVGVAKTIKYVLLAEPPTEYLYLPYRQNPQSHMVLLAESIGDPSTLVAPIRNVVRGIDANQPTYDVHTMEEFFQISTVGLMNTIIGMVAFIGIMGLGLSIVGLYGLVAYSASRRTKEIGIRMAIGADRSDVLRMVMREGLALALAGLVIGVVASAGAGRLLAAAFPGGRDEPDAVPFFLVVLVVLIVTAISTYLPARRASRVDPMIALRDE